MTLPVVLSFALNSNSNETMTLHTADIIGIVAIVVIVGIIVYKSFKE